MDIEDLEPRHKAAKPVNLEVMGVDELEEYIARLKAEIVRVEAALQKKKAHLGSAGSLFKS